MNETSDQTFSPFKPKKTPLFKAPDWIRRAINQFSLVEKTVFYILCVTMTLSAGALLLNVSNLFTRKQRQTAELDLHSQP